MNFLSQYGQIVLTSSCELLTNVENEQLCSLKPFCIFCKAFLGVFSLFSDILLLCLYAVVRRTFSCQGDKLGARISRCSVAVLDNYSCRMALRTIPVLSQGSAFRCPLVLLRIEAVYGCIVRPNRWKGGQLFSIVFPI